MRRGLRVQLTAHRSPRRASTRYRSLEPLAVLFTPFGNPRRGS